MIESMTSNLSMYMQSSIAGACYHSLLTTHSNIKAIILATKRLSCIHTLFMITDEIREGQTSV